MRISSDGCPAPWKSSSALSPGSSCGEGGDWGKLYQSQLRLPWLAVGDGGRGAVHFLTFPVGLGKGSCLPLEGLEVHGWRLRWLCGRRTQGLHGRQWLRFGKLVMLDIQLFL